MGPLLYDHHKSVAALVFFIKAAKSDQKILNKFILTQYIHLANRLAIKKWNYPITWDQSYSLYSGPMPIQTFNLLYEQNIDNELKLEQRYHS